MPNTANSQRSPTRVASAWELGVVIGSSEPSYHGRKVAPDRNAAEVRSFGAPRGDEAVADDTGWPDVASEARMGRAHLFDLVHRCQVDLLLRVEAGSQRPFVEQCQQRAGFD